MDRLFFIPAAQSPLKPGIIPAPAAERLRLLRLALAGQPHYEVDEQEIRRGGVSYTIDTVRNYAARFPAAALFYLVGSDHLSLLPQWREAEALAQLVEFVAVPRPGEQVQAPAGPFRVRILSGYPVSLSSSQIRARIGQGLTVGHLVPGAVAEAIANNRLYFSKS